jgi:hypothetical protein
VIADRLLEIFSLMERWDRERPDGFALCAVAAEFMVLDGAGIALTSDNDDLISLCTSNETARKLMDLEMTLGEGPTLDACRGNAAEVADLRNAVVSRWGTYSPEAVALGARAVFGYPIQLGAARFGALSLYRTSSGPLNAEQSSDGYLMASVLGRVILTTQAGGSRDTLMGELDGSSIFDLRVHQAAGMISVQGAMSVKDALVLLRAHAFAVGCQLEELADRVVSLSTRYELETDRWIEEMEI